MFNFLVEIAFFIQYMTANLSITLKSKKRAKKMSFQGGTSHSVTAEILDIFKYFNFEGWTKSPVAY